MIETRRNAVFFFFHKLFDHGILAIHDDDSQITALYISLQVHQRQIPLFNLREHGIALHAHIAECVSVFYSKGRLCA